MRGDFAYRRPVTGYSIAGLAASAARFGGNEDVMKTKYMTGKLRIHWLICGVLLSWCAGQARAESKTVRSEPVIEVNQTIPDTIEAGNAYHVEVVVRNAGKVP